MEKFKKNQLSKSLCHTINGGRHVKKFDTDGDGKWDKKYIYNNDGEITRIKYRYN